MKLFQKVHCKAYLKKVHDGVHIQIFNPDGTLCDAKIVDSPDYKAIAYKEGVKPNGLSDPIEIKDLSEWDGDSVEKIYRERTEEVFDGFLVGVTRLKVSGRIGTDWECVNDGFGDIREYGHCFKAIDEYPKVGVVYFHNNCKRYVLLDDMEVINR